MLVELLDLSPVSSISEAWYSVQLLDKLVEDSLLDWIDCCKNVPVNVSSTWWSCNTTFVNPSVVIVNHHHKVTILDLSRLENGSVCAIIIPVQGGEEVSDDLLLGIIKFDVCIINREHYAHGCIRNIVDGLMCKMNSVHLKIVSLTINSVLRPVMEMELDSSEPCVTAESISSKIR